MAATCARGSPAGSPLGSLLLRAVLAAAVVACLGELAAAAAADASPRKSFALPGSGPASRRRVARQAGSAQDYTEAEMQAMLNLHLEYRRNVTPPAADMNFIVSCILSIRLCSLRS